MSKSSGRARLMGKSTSKVSMEPHRILHMPRPTLPAIALTVVTVLALVGGCSDSSPGPDTTSLTTQASGLIISNPLPAAVFAPPAQASAALAGSSGSDVVYVSLTPGTVPTGSLASVRRVGDAASLTTVTDGGFDPVPVPAQVGDSIDVVVTDAGGAVVLQQRVLVAATRPPVIVRTEPPPRKRDVPLNAAMVIVFSEPVSGASLNASVQLHHGSSVVAGRVSLLQGSGDAVAFTPDVPLDAHTDYSLVVTTSVRDLDGNALTGGATVPFTTGSSTTGPAARIQMSPDSVLSTTVGATYQLAAVVRDAAGNALANDTVTWASDNTSVVTVSSSGLLTAVSDGYAHVTASVGAVTKVLWVQIAANPPASITIVPNPGSIGAGDTLALAATVRDAGGHLLSFPSPPVVWSSSDAAVATVAASDVSGGVSRAVVTALTIGNVTITATTGAAHGTATVTVGPPRPVASVTISPESTSISAISTVQLTATLKDSLGGPIGGRPVTWASSNTSVATVSSSGLITGASVGVDTITATAEGKTGTATVTVFAPGVVHVSAMITTYGAGPYPFDSLRVCDLMVRIRTPRGLRSTCTAGHSHDSPFPGDVSFPVVPGTDTLQVTGFVLARLPYRCDPLQTSLAIAVASGQTTEATFNFACPAPVSTSGVITFVGDFDGNSIPDVYAVAADGSGLANLTNSRQPAKFNPAWSPDGTHLAFIGSSLPYTGGTGGLYIMNADGSGVTLLPQWSVNAYIAASTPAWSPDGLRLALVCPVDDPASGNIWWHVCVMNADGSNLTALTSDLGYYYGAPTWSPDGTKLAFARGSVRPGWGDVFVMNADGSGLTQVTHDDHSGTPSWSPDGQRIAYSFADSTGNGGLFLMNPDGSGVTRLTSDSSAAPLGTLGAAEPSWSPAGTQIAFTRGAFTVNPGYWVRHVFVVNADGTGLRDLTNTYSDVYAPSWKP